MAIDPTLSIDEFLIAAKAGTRLIGLDLGTKTIGLALSDLGRGIASPMETIWRKKFTLDAELLLKICREQEVGGMVLGLPLNMNGTEGPRVQATRAFVRNLAPKTDLPITLWDERLSTAAVTRTLIEADSSRARRAEVVDKMAAAFILQGFLDRLSNMQGPRGSGRVFFGD
ncbi:Holliday junction resolvase RuvX [Roseibium sp. CAU 1637]|uniref:Putative pre-16S rRNA nuclease n=1 Tax=Roseibium limicola TaxID=2816037 RepID=A0A939EMU3_9HYPH|nr:Holliday junction resolvase RuvX [Roseibium limicola]MBO0344731.1 Holliday junction resolvase RuvX [Roseibium limicola]